MSEEKSIAQRDIFIEWHLNKQREEMWEKRGRILESLYNVHAANESYTQEKLINE